MNFLLKERSPATLPRFKFTQFRREVSLLAMGRMMRICPVPLGHQNTCAVSVSLPSTCSSFSSQDVQQPWLGLVIQAVPVRRETLPSSCHEHSSLAFLTSMLGLLATQRVCSPLPPGSPHASSARALYACPVLNSSEQSSSHACGWCTWGAPQGERDIPAWRSVLLQR